jgi:putative membrane protein insertion efficiency factor
MTRLVLVLIRSYQHSLSYVIGGQCRYYPSCSHYTYQAVEKYGWARGSWLGVRRIARCHPFARGGYDPVP